MLTYLALCAAASVGATLLGGLLDLFSSNCSEIVKCPLSAVLKQSRSTLALI